MGKDNIIALTYSITTLLITFIVGQILLSLYPDGNTIGSSILFILMNLVPMLGSWQTSWVIRMSFFTEKFLVNQKSM